MHRIILGIILLFCAWPVQSQYVGIPVRQSLAGNSCGGGACNGSIAWTMNVISGNNMICGFSWFGTTNTPTVTDTQSNTYTQKVLITSGSTPTAVYTTTATSTGSLTITATITGSTFVNGVCSEHPPVFSLTVDASSSSTYSGNPNPVTSNSVTTTKNHDFIYSYVGAFHNASQIGTGLLEDTTLHPLGFGNQSDAGAAEYKIPNTPGTYTMSFDNWNNMDQGDIVVVAFSAPSLTIQTATALPGGVINKAYDYTVLAAGGVSTYTWSVIGGALPSGMSLNSSTGRLSGTPTVSNYYNFTIQVTDGTTTTSKAFTLSVAISAGTIAVRQSQFATPGALQSTLTFPSNVLSGSVIVVTANENVPSFYGNGAQLCTDTVGTVYVPAFIEALKNFGSVQYFVGTTTAAGANIVSCVGSSAGQISGIFELTGAQASIDNFLVTRGSGGATYTSGSLSTLVPDEILIGMGDTVTTVGATMTVSAPFTGLSNKACSASYQIVTTVTGYTVTYTPTGNTDGNWLLALMGVRPSIGAVVPPPAAGYTWIL